MLLGYLVAFLITRIAVVVADLLLAPMPSASASFRRIRRPPVLVPTAHRLCRVVRLWLGDGRRAHRSRVFIGGRQLVAYVLGLGLLAIALEAVWRRPVAPDQDTEVPSPETLSLGRGAQNALLSVGIVLLWGLWVARAMPGFWLVLVIITLPLANPVIRRGVEHLLQPPGTPQVGDGPPSVIAVSIERGMRALLIIGAAAVLAWGWGIDLAHLASRRTRCSPASSMAR